MRRLRKIARDRKGAISTEYVALVGAVGLSFMFAVVALGPSLVRNYAKTRAVVISPLP